MLRTEEDGARIKPAGMIMNYTYEQLVEIAKCEEDPIYFIENYVFIQHPTKGRMKFNLFPFQRDLINVYNTSNRVIAMLSRQCGKALELSTPIKMSDGSIKMMKDIEIGDVVLDRYGKPTTVVFVSREMERDEIYDVEFDTGEVIRADAGHIWSCSLASHKNGEEVLVTTDEMGGMMLTGRGVGEYVKIQGEQEFHVVDIRRAGPCKVRCIQVDNQEQMYQVGISGIPTHNTTTAAGYLLWYACFHSDATIMIASKDQSGADEVMERLWYAYEELPWFLKPGVIKNDVQTKKLDNQTRIRAIATTKTSGRGKSNTVVYLDEFAFVPPGIANDFWTALYPTLSTGGKLIITSTPNSDEDKFARIWFNAQLHETSDVWRDRLSDALIQQHGEEQEEIETIYENEDAKRLGGLMDETSAAMEDGDIFTGFHAHWTSIPSDYDKEGNITAYRGEKFKRQTLAAGLTDSEWNREYDCSFISGDETLIAGEKLAALKLYVHPPRFVDRWGCRWYEEIRPNVGYAVALDPSDGVDQDNACIQVWEIPRLVQVAEWHSNKVGQDEQTRMLRRVLQRLYHLQQDIPEHDGSVNIYYSVERNGLGIGILRTIEEQDERSFPGWLIDSSMISMNNMGDGMTTRVNPYRGMVTTSGTKRRYCLELKSLVERNIFIPRSSFLASEMKTFVKRANSWAAKTGAKDDIVMSCVIMCHLIDELRSQEPDLDEMISPDIDDYDEEDEDHPDNRGMIPVF